MATTSCDDKAKVKTKTKTKAKAKSKTSEVKTKRPRKKDMAVLTDAEIRSLSADEAVAIKKQEEAIKLRRLNKLAGKDLIEASTLREIIKCHYQHCVTTLSEQLDLLFLKHNIPEVYHQDSWKMIVMGLNQALEKTLQEIAGGKY
jgi:hypothetical protein